jgi:Zn-finger nucleic acid-binding protein
MRDFTFDVCDTCGGIWFDEEELIRTARTFAEGIPGQTEEFTPILEENDVPPPVVVQKKEWPFEDGVACPVDGTTAERFVYSGDSGIILDKCKICGGIWFDGDELIHMARYLKPNSRYEMGKAMIQQMNQFEKERQELAQLPIKLPRRFLPRRDLCCFLPKSHEVLS